MSDLPQATAPSAVPATNDADRLIDFLRDRDMPCPICEYNLRGLTSPRCPECGHLLQLSVTLVEPYLKAWVSLLAVMCAGAGLGVLWILIILMHGRPPPPTGILSGMLTQIVMIPVVPLVIVKRRAFLRLSRARQWQLALVAIVTFAASMIYMMAVIR